MKLYHQLGMIMKLFNKKMKRSPFELPTTKTEYGTNNPRHTNATPKRTQESKETTTTEPQERKTIILDCTCGSWGHPCEEVKHDCPTNCIVETGF